MADGTEVRRLAVADRDHELGPDEDVDLTELDLFDVIEVASRPEDDEQRRVVPLELRPLMGTDRVLDGELMQPELRGEGLDLLLLGSVETDPRHPIGVAPEALEGLGQRRRRVDPIAIDVDGAVDHPRPAVVVGRDLGVGETVVVAVLADRRPRPAPADERSNRRVPVLVARHNFP